MYLKLSLACAAIALGGISMLASPLTADEALGRALSTNPGSIQRIKADATAFSLTESTDTYFIFNKRSGNGYIIVGADTDAAPVLGYSDTGSFDADNVPDNMKWWLSQYSLELENYKNSSPSKSPVRAMETVQRNPVAPLVTTKWNQGDPFNRMTPEINGYRCATGCVATAMSQIMRYHKWPERAMGSTPDYDFEFAVYDWDSMIDDYNNSSEYTDEQADAVALLMRQCGAAVSMQYSPYMSGAYDYNVHKALVENFSYDPSLCYYQRDYFSLSSWEDMVYIEIAEGRPVYYSGSSSGGGHAFVCDGYEGDRYFHINWGWGGFQDGYFRLSALNPGSVGIGGGSGGGYNSMQAIFTGVKPTKNPGNATQSLIVCGGDLVSSGDWHFMITNSPLNANMIYNPLYMPQEVFLTMKMVSVADPSDVRILEDEEYMTINPFYGVTAFDMPEPKGEVKDGDYILSLVYKAKGSDTFKDVQVVYGRQSYVLLTVTDGEYTFTNTGAPSVTESNLLVNELKLLTPAEDGESGLVRLTVTNAGNYDWNQDLELTMTSTEDEFYYTSMPVSLFLSPGETLSQIVSYSYEAEPGTYNLDLRIDETNAVSKPISFEVTPSSFDMPASTQISGFGIEPSYFEAGSSITFGLYMRNLTKAQVSEVLFINVLNENKEEVASYETGRLNIPANFFNKVTFNDFVPALSAGSYYWRVTDSNGKAVTHDYAFIVTEGAFESDGLTYNITDNEQLKAEIIAPESGQYSGEIYIPDELSDGFEVTSVATNAFTRSAGLESISLPACVDNIGDGYFYFAENLKHLEIRNPNPPALGEKAFGENVKDNLSLTVAPCSANIYKHTPGWDTFSFPYWEISLPDDCSVISIPETDPTDGTPYNPFYLNHGEALDFVVSHPQHTELLVHYSQNDGEEHTMVSNGAVSLPAITADKAVCRIETRPSEKTFVTAIEINPYSVVAESGMTYTLIANVLPENASDKGVVWESSNPSSGIVDQTGVVTVVGIEPFVIKATAADGSGVFGTCTFDFVDGIYDINAGDSSVTVYTATGILIGENAPREIIDTLLPGFYIINGKKILVK